MKRFGIQFSALLFAAVLWTGCNSMKTPVDDNGNDPENVAEQITQGPIEVLFPSPVTEIGNLSLTDSQMAYQQAAGRFALGTLSKLYKGQSFVMSPLSLQMALSLTASGASGQTEKEILSALGFDALGTDGLNAYSKALLEQLPALDLGVSLSLANALVLNKQYQLVDTYKEQIASHYFAPVVNADFKDEAATLSLINDWSKRNTNGLIPVILENVNPLAVAYLLNALYFKSLWNMPFREGQIVKGEDFKTGGSTAVKVDYLRATDEMPYADMGDYRMITLVLGEKMQFFYTLFLPKEDNGLSAMLKELESLDWSSRYSMMQGTYVQYRLPKYKTESSFDLKSALQALGVKRAFTSSAEFDRMISGGKVMIDEVIQKATLTVDENGVEGAATTEIGIMPTSTGQDPPQPVIFNADHPFAYVISERTSGAILFTGVFDGK